jgi:hypothetical protein
VAIAASADEPGRSRECDRCVRRQEADEEAGEYGASSLSATLSPTGLAASSVVLAMPPRRPLAHSVVPMIEEPAPSRSNAGARKRAASFRHSFRP